MASSHNNSLGDAGPPAPQESLHDVLTDNIGKNPKPDAEARTHANGKEIAMCVPVVATSELHCVLQDEQEHNGTAIPGSSNLYPELTEEISQHKQAQAEPPPAHTKTQLRYKVKQVRCNLSASYLEHRHRRFCSMKARAAAAAAKAWPPGILKRIWAAITFVYSCRLLLYEWALVNIDLPGPLAPLIVSLVYVMVIRWFVYSDPAEGLPIKLGICTLYIIWSIDACLCLKPHMWPSREQSNRDNTLEYFRQLNYERASILRGIS